jgi:hypothetical protein
MDNPFYRFFRPVSFLLEHRLWRKMPRHPSFKHEYWDGKLHWTPRPNTCDIYLDLAQWKPPPPSAFRAPRREDLTVRQMQEEDWPKLPRTFCAAAIQHPPLSQWDGPAPLRASRCIIQWARDGKDGPLVPSACLVATGAEPLASKSKEFFRGATIVTLVPAHHLQGGEEIQAEPLPHLDWIFVPWMEQRRGIATLLLERLVQELHTLGHRTLASTVLTANTPALLWHWSRGFRLLPNE